MKQRLIGLFGLLSIVLVTVLYWGQWIGPQAGTVYSLTQAELVTIGNTNENKQSRVVTLPHAWSKEEQSSDSTGVYQIRLPAVSTDTPFAISIVRSSNTTEIGYTGKPPLLLDRLTGRQDKVALARLGHVTGGELIEIRVPQRFGIQAGLSEIKFGPESVLERQAWVISILRFIGRSYSIAVAGTIGLLFTISFCSRPKLILLLLGFTGISYALQQWWLDVIGYWESDNLELAAYLFLSTNVVLGCSLSLMAALRQRMKGLLILVLLLLPLTTFFLFTQTGTLEFRRTFNIFAMCLWFGYSVISCWPQLIKNRHWFLLTMIFSIIARLAISGFSSVSNRGFFGFAEINNQLTMVPLTVTLLGVMLARYLDQAFKNYEMVNRELREELDDYKAQLARASENEKKLAAIHAAEIERNHWMQEIHDGLGSHLIAARFLADKAHDNQSLHAVKESIDDGIEQLRILVESLAVEKSSVPSLLGAMRYRMVKRLNATGLNVRWDVDPMIEAVEATPQLALNVQRIIQEAITNVLKHAQATTIHIHIFTEGGEMVVRVEDDGKGLSFDAAAKGRGIANMKIRAEKFGGRVSWSTLAPGTRVELRFPNQSPERA